MIMWFWHTKPLQLVLFMYTTLENYLMLLPGQCHYELSQKLPSYHILERGPGSQWLIVLAVTNSKMPQFVKISHAKALFQALHMLPIYIQ